MLNMVVSIDAI